MSTAEGEKGLELELLKKTKLILNKEGRICAQMEQYVVRNKNDSNPFKNIAMNAGAYQDFKSQ